MEETIGKASLRDAAIGTGIAVDKMLALTGQMPTFQIANIVMPSAEERAKIDDSHRALDAIARRLAAAQAWLPVDSFIISMRSNEVRRKDCVINEMRFGSPLHKCNCGAVIQDFYPCAFQHFYTCHLACCRVDVQSEPAASLPVPGVSRLWINWQWLFHEVRSQILWFLFEWGFAGLNYTSGGD
jgi:hypothetical protein